MQTWCRIDYKLFINISVFFFFLIANCAKEKPPNKRLENYQKSL